MKTFNYFLIILLLTACQTAQKPDRHDLIVQTIHIEGLRYQIIAHANSEENEIGRKFYARYDLKPLITGEAFTIVDENILMPGNFDPSITSQCSKITNSFKVTVHKVLTVTQKVRKENHFIYKELTYIGKCSDVLSVERKAVKLKVTPLGYKRNFNMNQSKDVNSLRSIELIKEDPLKYYRKNSRLCQAINQNQIYQGMPQGAVELSWGKADKVIATNENNKIRRKYIYGETRHVYTNGSKVTSWQE